MANQTDQQQATAPPPPPGPPATHVASPTGRAAIEASGLEQDRLLELLHLLVLCRYFDERMETLYRQGRLQDAIATYEAALKHSPREEVFARRLEEWKKEAELHRGLFESRGAHFSVLFQGPADENVARRALELLEAAYWRVGTALTAYPTQPIMAVLYTQEQFRDVTRSPDWAAAERRPASASSSAALPAAIPDSSPRIAMTRSLGLASGKSKPMLRMTSRLSSVAIATWAASTPGAAATERDTSMRLTES